MAYRPAGPRDTVSIFERVLQERPGDVHNPGLIFHRFAPDLASGNDRNNEGLKLEGLRRVRDVTLDSQLLEAVRRRLEAAWREMGARVLRLTTRSRTVVGLGSKGVYEVGFAFHRTWGFPVIPGSSLKGVARSYALLVEGLDQRSTEFQEVFGYASGDQREADGRAGRVTFWDAIPESNLRLELDVINPHYPRYYQDSTGRTPPSNWQSPVPIHFLTIPPGARLITAIAPLVPGEEASGAIDRATRWLTGGLLQLGAGAKTASGYGWIDAYPIQPSRRR